MAMMPQAQPDAVGANHPLAFRMAAIAFLNQNIVIGCIWGSFSVLLASVETRLGVSRELSTLSVPVVNLATALCAPVVGTLATRVSLRMLMLVGALLSTAGFALLATTSSYPLYLVAFGLLLGPGMAIGVITPGTLVSRWYVVNRGRALGITSMPVIIALVPLLSSWALQSYGVAATYAMLGALSAVCLVANLFVIDQIPGVEAAAPTADTPAADGAMTMPQLLRSPRFWLVMLATIASVTGSVLITANMVPIASGWGLSATLAATLLTVQSLVGIAGTVFFGWVADRLGGVATLAILLFDAAILWALLLIGPGFVSAAVIVGLIGLHGAGAMPVLGLAITELFGRESYSRAFGLFNIVNLPFGVLCVPASALVYARTGSYAAVIMGQAAFLLFGALLAFFARRRGTTPRPT
jgi:MFS family permease